MCTVTLIAQRSGYRLGMNRDEKLVRPPGEPPEKRAVNGRVALCPSERGGGTWIAVNDQGATLALINWYAITTRVTGKAVSRGVVVNATSTGAAPAFADTALAKLPLDRINPFRLIGVFPATKSVVEWRWNLNELVRKIHPWKTQQWISSGFDEPGAQCERGQTFRDARTQKTAGTIGWLRRLHRSHLPKPGPYSTCMHRADAATVSYTEITVSKHRATLHYHAGAPCSSWCSPQFKDQDSSRAFQSVATSAPGSSAPAPPARIAANRSSNRLERV